MEKKQVKLNNGETYYYLDSGKGSKVLLLVHGNLSSSVYFKPLFGKMDDDTRLIAVDLRGFGDSSYNQPINTLGDLADDLALFLDAINVKKVNILGWSLGGGVALMFAANYPEKVEKLILMNSASHKGYPVFKKDSNGMPLLGQVYCTKQELANDPIQVVPLLKALVDKNAPLMTYIYNMTIYTNNKPAPEDYALFIDETLKQRNLVDVDYALCTLNMSKEATLYAKGDEKISKIKAPTLHIWGTLDKTVPEYMVIENIKALEKQSTYVKFENCGHSPLVDKLDDLAKTLKDFIA
jgi:pimeloyl-ACP methyl ester carboxylesterase